MGGIFDDVFKEDWGMDETEAKNEPLKEDTFDTGIWKSGSNADQWNTDEPWTSELTPEEEADQEAFDMTDFFK